MILYIAVWTAFAAAFLYSVWLLLGAQGDLAVTDTAIGEDGAETETLLEIAGAAEKTLVIHDDGTGFPDSCGGPAVARAVRGAVRDRGVRVRCLSGQENGFMQALAGEFPDRVSVRYMDSGTRMASIGFMIADGGRLMYLRWPKADRQRRTGIYRKADRWWMAAGTHRRCARYCMDLFRHGLESSVPAGTHG